MRRAWREQPERGTRWALRAIRWIALHVGRRPARLLLYPIAAYFLLTAGEGRRASRDYLGRLRGRPASLWAVFRHFHCFAATILDRVFLLVGRHDLFDIRVHGIEALQSQIERGRGALLLGTHHGSFDMLRALGAENRRVRLKVLMDRGQNRMVTELLEALDPRITETVIDPHDPNAVLAVKEHVDRGYLVALLGDRVLDRGDAVDCRFLGGEARLPTGAFRLAAALGSPVILFFGLYRGGNRYDAYFEPWRERIDLPRPRSRAALEPLAQAFADRMEHYVRLAPLNWFNFYGYWTA